MKNLEERIAALELLNRILGYLEPSNVNDLVYRTPAMVMRMAADEMEQKERDIYAFKQFINTLER